MEGFSVRSDLNQEGWGATLDFPGLVWSRNGIQVDVQVLHSKATPEHWPRLDDLEGECYLQTLAPVSNDNGNCLVGNIYVRRQIVQKQG